MKLKGIQVVSCANGAGFDSGDLTAEDVADLFGKTQGYKEREPNVTPTPAVEDEVEDDDF